MVLPSHSFFHSAVGSGFLAAIPSSGLWRWFSVLILPFGGGVWVFGGDSLFGFVEVVLFFILPFGGGVWVFGGDSLFGFVEVVLSSHSSIWWWGLGFWWRFPLRVCGGGSFFLFFHSAVGSGLLVAIPSSGLWRWLLFLILRFFHSAVGSGFLVAIPSSGLWRWFFFLILPFGGGVWVFGGDSLFRFVEVVLCSYSSVRRWGLGFWWRFPLRGLFGFVEVVLFSYSSIRRWGLGFWWRFPLRVCGGGSFFYSSIRRWGLGFWRRFPLRVCGGGSLFSFFHLAVGLKCFYVLF